jgi:hypothetical protein
MPFVKQSLLLKVLEYDRSCKQKKGVFSDPLFSFILLPIDFISNQICPNALL